MENQEMSYADKAVYLLGLVTWNGVTKEFLKTELVPGLVNEIERLKTENSTLHDQAINMAHVAAKRAEQCEAIPMICHRTETVGGRITCIPCEICPKVCPRCEGGVT